MANTLQLPCPTLQLFVNIQRGQGLLPLEHSPEDTRKTTGSQETPHVLSP